jgi:hypothetical protein
MAEINLERIIKAPWTIDHESVVEAVLADIADIVPLIGELAGIVRILEALERKGQLPTDKSRELAGES